MVTLKVHILPHPDLQPPGCRGSGEEPQKEVIGIAKSRVICHSDKCRV